MLKRIKIQRAIDNSGYQYAPRKPGAVHPAYKARAERIKK